MNATYVRLAFGCAQMAGACFVAIRLGDRPERRTAILLAICWTLTTVIEVATGRLIEPVMLGDAAFGVGLLWFAWRYNKPFLWVLIAMEAALFFLHALLYETGQRPSPLQAIGNNALASLGLLVLVGASIRNWRRRVRASASAGWRRPRPGSGGSGS